MTLISIGRTFFAIALLGLGVEHFVFHEFVTARAPAWPDGVPGKVLWVDSTGILIIVAALCIATRQFGRQAMLVFALMVLVWALLRLLPIVATSAFLGGSWTLTGKALTFVGGALAVGGTLPLIRVAEEGHWWRFANATQAFARLGGICLGCFLIISGIQHFKFTAFVVTLIPSWLPGNHTWWAWIAGVSLIAGGLGLFTRRTAKLAGQLCGLMIFSWFWILHLPRIFMSVSDGVALFEALAFSGIALLVAGAIGDGARPQVVSTAE